MSYVYCFFKCEAIKVNITMDVKKKEMDLLSNSIAAYAHIKGKSLHSPAQYLHTVDLLVISKEICILLYLMLFMLSFP